MSYTLSRRACALYSLSMLVWTCRFWYSTCRLLSMLSQLPLFWNRHRLLSRSLYYWACMYCSITSMHNSRLVSMRVCKGHTSLIATFLTHILNIYALLLRHRTCVIRPYFYNTVPSLFSCSPATLGMGQHKVDTTPLPPWRVISALVFNYHLIYNIYWLVCNCPLPLMKPLLCDTRWVFSLPSMLSYYMDHYLDMVINMKLTCHL